MSVPADYEKLGVFYLGRELDMATREPGASVLYDSRDLTTHAVCVGMTGSGKTGLCLSLLEEAALDGVPAICIDPKGDLGNLLLAFPGLDAAAFEPWMDTAEAARKGVTPGELAAKTANTWKQGLADWGQEPERVQRFHDAADIAIYTPGAQHGLALSVLRSFAPPAGGPDADTGATRERAAAIASSLLSLLGRDADPLQSRDHILLATLLDHAWRSGASPDLESLVRGVRKPPFEKVGALDLETFFAARERTQLAMALNNLLASPGFAAWTSGDALDAQTLLYTAAGKPRLSIISIAHLSDPERMFVVTLVLNEVIAWMRRQTGTSSLRALLYMDEIFGYFPPTANPPAKAPMLTLLKQARAYGLGCVLATQNPVDLDYKGLSNAGTWWIGRLQTERDKQRLVEGLDAVLGEEARGNAAPDRGTLSDLIGSLAPRTFVMRNVHEDAPVLMQSRWALSYLRGPLTAPEIATLMKARKSAALATPAMPVTSAMPAADMTPERTHASGAHESRARASGARSGGAHESSTRDGAASRPALPPDITERFAAATSAATYRASAMATARLHFVDAKLKLDEWREITWAAPFDATGKQVLWNEAEPLGGNVHELRDEPAAGARFAELPAAALRAKSYADWGKTLRARLYEVVKVEVLSSKALGMHSNSDENEAAFRARVALAARERRDAAVEDLRSRYASRVQTLADRIRRAEDRADRERAQLSEQRVASAMSIGSAIFGALLGRKRVSAANVGRASSAVRSASRIGRERADVSRADDSLEVLRARLAELEAECEREVADLDAAHQPQALELLRIAVSPRKSDIVVSAVGILWRPSA